MKNKVKLGNNNFEDRNNDNKSNNHPTIKR